MNSASKQALNNAYLLSKWENVSEVSPQDVFKVDVERIKNSVNPSSPSLPAPRLPTS